MKIERVKQSNVFQFAEIVPPDALQREHLQHAVDGNADEPPGLVHPFPRSLCLSPLSTAPVAHSRPGAQELRQHGQSAAGDERLERQVRTVAGRADEAGGFHARLAREEMTQRSGGESAGERKNNSRLGNKLLRSDR